MSGDYITQVAYGLVKVPRRELEIVQLVRMDHGEFHRTTVVDQTNPLSQEFDKCRGNIKCIRVDCGLHIKMEAFPGLTD